MVKVGIAGLAHGMAHVVEVLKHSDLEISALCARTTDGYERLLGRNASGPLDSVTFTEPMENLIAEARRMQNFEDVAFFTDFDTFLSEGEMNAVILAVPIYYNASYAIKAIESGLHVFASKPFAHDLDAGRELKRVASVAQTLFMMNFEFRYAPLMVKIRELIDHGEIGPVRQMWWNTYRMPFRPSYRRKETSGGAYVAEICHWIDLFHLFNAGSRFTRVCAFGGLDVLSGQDFADNAVTIVDYENAIRGSINFTYFTDQPEHNLFGVIGESGKITGTTEGAGRLTLFSGDKHKQVYEVNPETAHQGHLGFDASHYHFADALLGRTLVDPAEEAELGYESLLLSVAAARSLEEGHIVYRDQLE